MKTILLLATFFLTTGLSAQTLQPTEKEALIKLMVSDFKDVPRAKDVVLFKSTKTKKEYECTTNSKGKSEILLPKGDMYLISYKVIGSEEKFDSLVIPQLAGTMTSTLTIKYEPAKTITLDNVYFDFDMSTIKPASYPSLDDLVEFMNLKSTMTIEIAGHTDNIGDSAYNKKLSQSRAEAVRDYLIKKGVAASRISAKGYGDDEPVASNDNEDGRQKNRRTEVRIISE
jgi:OmpA-OmpF porin, OOP family